MKGNTNSPPSKAELQEAMRERIAYLTRLNAEMLHRLELILAMADNNCLELPGDFYHILSDTVAKVKDG